MTVEVQIKGDALPEVFLIDGKTLRSFFSKPIQICGETLTTIPLALPLRKSILYRGWKNRIRYPISIG